MTRSAIGGGAAAVVFSTLAVAGCTTTGTQVARPPSAASPLASSEAQCRVTGPPEVLAKRVFVPRGVEAIERETGFEVRFGRDRSRCLAIEWSAPENPPVESSCPSSDGRPVASDAREDEAMLACESGARDPSGVEPRIVAYDVPQVAVVDTAPARRMEGVFGRPLRSPFAGTDPSAVGSVLLPVGDAGFLSLWVEGGAESHALHARSVTGWGDPAGPIIDLSPPDVSVIGRASAALGPTRDGLVVYLASTGDEFDVFGTPIACASHR